MLAYDRETEEVKAWGVRYVSKEELLRSCDIISLHCPLLPSTYHIIDAARCIRLISRMHPLTLQYPSFPACMGTGQPSCHYSSTHVASRLTSQAAAGAPAGVSMGGLPARA